MTAPTDLSDQAIARAWRETLPKLSSFPPAYRDVADYVLDRARELQALQPNLGGIVVTEEILEGLRLADQFFDGQDGVWQWDDGEWFPGGRVRAAYLAASAAFGKGE